VRRGKITLQLTPLLDLLLIVIFAQYLEMQEQARLTQQTHQSDLTELQSESELVRSERTRIKQERDTLKSELASAWKELDRQTLQSEELRQSLTRTAQERDAVAGLLPELFRLPPETANRLLDALADDASPIPPDQIARLKAELQRLAVAQPAEAIQHLLTYDELRKRCDLWEIYLAQNGVAHLTASGKLFRFRAETPEAFERELFDALHLLPQPKALVLILLSHGDVRAETLEAALQGLPRATERMRADQNGRTRFEYGVLGFRNLSPAETPP